jgi:Spy/CpxP family protein refolding chaperone
MSQQHSNGNGNWLKLSLVTLVVLNLALMASIWLPQLKRSPAKESKARGMGGREHDIAMQFLEETLKLNPQQKENTAKLREDHFLKTDALRKGINQLRRQIMDEVLASSPDKEKVERLAIALGEKQGSLEKLTFYHFLNLYNLCRPEQKEKFRSMLSELLDRLKPPPPDTARRPRKEARTQIPSTDRQRPPKEEEPGIEAQAAVARTPEEMDRSQSVPSGEAHNEVSRIENQTERLRNRLGLSDALVEKLRPIVERFAGLIDQNRSQAAGDPGDQRQAEKALKDQRDEAIKSILTEEQQVLFEQMKQEKRGQDPPPRSPRED